MLAESAPATGARAANPAADARRIGTFKQVEGEAWAGRGEARRAAEPGAGVVRAKRLSTGRNGAAALVMKDGTVLTMGPNTTMNLRRFEFDNTT